MSALALSGGFGALDWGVVAAVLIGTTLLGHRLAGKQASLRDFFLGGRKLPWYAVAASIAATEISAVTYISLPWAVARPGGDMTYLQVVLIGSLITRALVGFWLVPAYYRREIYSPYDFVGERLGEPARRATSGLFALGGILAQSVRVYMTALVLVVLLHDELARVEAWSGLAPMTSAVIAIALVAILWTWMGGIATVVWTDAVLFLLFLAGIAVALGTVHTHLDGGLAAAFADGARAGKTRWIDTSFALDHPYTLWTALFLLSWGQLGAYGCDQLMTQRLFCCRDAREARKAILASIVAGAIVVACALVGVALWSYYQAQPLEGEAAALVAQSGDRLLPVFVAQVVAPGLKGVVIAGVFAAAISSLDSILAALSQTTLSAVVVPWRARRGVPEDPRATVRWSRGLVLGWGVVLAAAALGCQWIAGRWDEVLSMALSMAGFTQGALLAGFLLAFLPLRRRTRGFVLAAPVSVVVVAYVSYRAWLPWPWYAPIGCATTLLLALLLDRAQTSQPNSSSVA